MKLTTICLTAILSGATLMAQPAPPEGHRGPRGFQAQELQAHLQLTEEQVAALKANREALREATQPLMQQIREKKGQLREEMSSATPNSGTVGQLNVEIKDVMEQIKTLREESRASSVASLDGSQQAALAELQRALELHHVAQQAAGANLLAAPDGSFGMGGMGGMGAGPRGMRGPHGKGGMRGGFGPGPGPGPGPAPDAN
ncbi:MAG: periplasmic heavy metal sensor [Acidobacteria bacterium]|nr:periplasmic heavy metal sensor [Acidobacteriota bacterium]